jgi:hypothetical protein
MLAHIHDKRLGLIIVPVRPDLVLVLHLGHPVFILEVADALVSKGRGWRTSGLEAWSAPVFTLERDEFFFFEYCVSALPCKCCKAAECSQQPSQSAKGGHSQTPSSVYFLACSATSHATTLLG